MITIYAASGDTLSGIAAQYGTTYQAIAAASHISDPNVISVGEKLIIPKGGHFTSWTAPTSSGYSPAASSSATSSPSSSSSTSSSGYHIPGVSDGTAACIAMRESTNGAGSSNIFQISNYYPGESLAQQEAAAGQIAATQGVHSAWGVYDGC